MIKNILHSLIECKSLIKKHYEFKANVTKISYNSSPSIRIIDITKENWS